MKRIVLDLQCAMFADAITMALERSDPDFRVLRSDAPGKTAAICKSSLAYALIMEVTGYTPWRLEERLRLRDEVGRLCPSCKVLLLVDENADRALAALMLPGSPPAARKAVRTRPESISASPSPRTAAPSPRLRWRAAMWSFKRAARAKFTTGCPST